MAGPPDVLSGRPCASYGTRQAACGVDLGISVRSTVRSVLSAEALPGRGQDHRDRPALHRLPHPADALRGVHEARGADASRPVRLLLRGHAGYGEVGRRRADMVCWGTLNAPEVCDFLSDHMT